MKLITAAAWALETFEEGSRPSEVTLGRWLRNGTVPGRKIGGIWYVDRHAWDAGDDELVQRVLEAG